MPAYVAFLRAINLGARRKYPMAELRAALAEAGYEGVQTHLQTGNVLLTAPGPPAEIEADLEHLFAADRGFEVATIVLTPAELSGVARDADAVAGETPPEHGHYVELLREEPVAELAARVEQLAHPGQRFVVRGRAIHALYDVPYHRAKGYGAGLTRELGVMTNRNVKVVRALAGKWGE